MATATAVPVRKGELYEGPETVAIEMVTPELAEEWLTHNVNNRLLTDRQLDKIAAEVETLGWRLGPSVLFADDGTLLDGQHRLRLIADGDVTVAMIVARDLPLSSWDAIDKGKPRRLADSLLRRGEANAEALAKVIRLRYYYEEYGYMSHNPPPTHRVSDAALLGFLDSRPQLRHATSRGSSLSGSTALTRTIASACYSLFADAHGTDEADSFFDGLNHPYQLEADSPIVKLRDRLDKHTYAVANNNMQGRLTYTAMAALTVIAFNKWITGEAVQLLQWRPGGKAAQSFPQVDGFDIDALD